LTLTRGWVLPAAIMIFLCVLSRYRRQRVYGLLLGVALPIAAIITAIWLIPIALYQPFDGSPYTAWMNWNRHQIGWLTGNNLIYFFRYTPWFAWPAWPFAAWAVYAWRKQERALHISVPLAFLCCFILLAFLNPNKEESLFLPLLPPLAILAAFGLPTIKRSTINAIDWFSLMVFTGIAAIIWFGWIAEISGWPTQTAKRILSWAPGYQPEFQFPSFVIALLFTVAWFGLVYWRISRQPAVLWRAVVLSSGGVILSWLLLLTLWLPLINQRITYAPVATELANQFNMPYTCINSNVGPSQRASFAYFGALHFATLNQKNCEWYLAQTARRSKTSSPYMVQKLNKENWDLIWQGHRAADKDEFFSLYRKK
jgi:4-amino-4-deoxy-L-arabinose transferase-like glycosyltransferase